MDWFTNVSDHLCKSYINQYFCDQTTQSHASECEKRHKNSACKRTLILSKLPSKPRKSHFRESKFQHFPEGTCPRTSLEITCLRHSEPITKLSGSTPGTTHIGHICSKASKRLYALKLLKRSGVQSRDLRLVYCSFIRPFVEYACLVWHSSLPLFLSDQVEHIQRVQLR